MKRELCPFSPVSLSLKRLREVKGFVDARCSEPCVKKDDVLVSQTVQDLTVF
jgi:hypothetical protein